MRISIPRLLDLSLFGNAGWLRLNQETDEPGLGHPYCAGPGLGDQSQSAALNKTNDLVYGVGLKLMVSRVWTDTGRPFIV